MVVNFLKVSANNTLRVWVQTFYMLAGNNWREVYCDDRIPCSLDTFPLFLTTSDFNETCILILQKCLAKYLNCYGYIGLCGNNRFDALDMGIRLLTG